jgi:hypothetical protein
VPGSCFRELLPPVTDRGGKPNLLLVVTNDRHYYTVPYTDTVFSKMRSRCGAFPPYAYLSTPICGPTRATLLGVNWPHSAPLRPLTQDERELLVRFGRSLEEGSRKWSMARTT